MKLSLKKKLGHVHVRGGKLLRVLVPHKVSTRGHSTLEVNQPSDLVRGTKPPPRFRPGQKYDTAGAGDLALEIIRAGDGVRIGWSYLSGQAIRLNTYFDTARDDWFEEAKLVYVDLDGVDSMEGLTKAVLGGAFGGHDVAGIFRELPTAEHAQGAARTVLEILGGYKPVALTKEAHVLGLIVGGKATCLIHSQPERDASSFSATQFQVALVLSSLGKLPYGQK